MIFFAFNIAGFVVVASVSPNSSLPSLRPDKSRVCASADSSTLLVTAVPLFSSSLEANSKAKVPDLTLIPTLPSSAKLNDVAFRVEPLSIEIVEPENAVKFWAS